VHSRAGFADFDRANDVWVLDAFAIPRFAKEAGYGRPVLSQFLAKYFDRDGAVVGMLRSKNGGSSAFSDFALQ
jgi:hypothetical protein